MCGNTVFLVSMTIVVVSALISVCVLYISYAKYVMCRHKYEYLDAMFVGDTYGIINYRRKVVVTQCSKCGKVKRKLIG